MEAQQLNIDVIANNLANVNTTGFKKSARLPGPALPDDPRPGAPTSTQHPDADRHPIASARGRGRLPINTQGDYTQTGNDLDVAIEAPGSSRCCWRRLARLHAAGALKLRGSDGSSSRRMGSVQPTTTIASGSKDVTIGADARSARSPRGTSSPATIGQLQTARFVNRRVSAPSQRPPPGTETSGTPELGVPARTTEHAPAGFLENSNVSVVRGWWR